MSTDAPAPQAPEPTRPAPRLTFCDHCGRRPAEWVCGDCRLKLCAAHRTCPSCDRDR